jgi:ketosteroid isomerase-like protein
LTATGTTQAGTTQAGTTQAGTTQAGTTQADTTQADTTQADTAQGDAALAVVARFNEAFNRHDVDAVMALMTPDAVFEGTAPPDGDRYAGALAVRGAWEAFFAASPDASFSTEELIASGDRVIVRWIYHWDGTQGGAGHVRGVDLFRVRDNLIAEKLAYVKG